MNILQLKTWQQHIVVFLSLSVLGFLAFSNAIPHPFVHDDIPFIQNNPNIATFEWQSIWCKTTTPDKDFSVVNPYYRPLLEVFYRLEYRMWGMDAHGFHLFNVLLHIVNSFLIYAIFHEFGFAALWAFIVAVFFLVAPVQSESVACVSGISNILYVLFACLSLYGFLRFLRWQNTMASIWLVFSLLFFAIGLLAKEQIVFLPILLGWYLIFFYEGKKKVAWFSLSAYLVVIILYFGMRHVLVGGSQNPWNEPWSEYRLLLLAIPRSVVGYLRIIFLPTDLHYYRSIDVLASNVKAWIELSLIFATLIYVYLKCTVQSRRWMLLSVGWFFICLSPTLNLIPLINEYSWILNAEHFLYLPMVGIVTLSVYGVQHLFHRFAHARKVIGGFIVSLIILCIVLTRNQNDVWRDEIALFERTLKYENMARIHMLMANAYYIETRYDESVAQNQKAIAILDGYLEKVSHPGARQFYLSLKKNALNNIAQDLNQMRRFDQSLMVYQRIVELDPSDWSARNNLATLYAQGNDIDKAIEHFTIALRIKPDEETIRLNLILCYKQKQDLLSAKKIIDEGLSINPSSHRLMEESKLLNP